MAQMTKKQFDRIIRENIIAEMEKKGEKTSIGYVLNGNKYDDYYSQEAFKAFLDKMKTDYIGFYDKYTDSPGNETIEKNDAPPKMASVASSSRFCYLALRNGFEKEGINKVEVEKKCKINGMKGCVHANLDAFCKENNTYIEVKCHEIFDHHTIKMSGQYRKHLKEEFELEVDTEDKSEVVIELEKFGVETPFSRFDIKQLICHLLGISSRMEEDEKATLMYLFFKPIPQSADERKMMAKVFDELEGEIRKIFNSKPIKTFVNKHNIKLKVLIETEKVMKSLNEAMVDVMEY